MYELLEAKCIVMQILLWNVLFGYLRLLKIIHDILICF